MAKDIKSSVRRLQRAKTDIVNAIETKGVSVPDGAKIDDMPELISHIKSGIDTSDATATASDIAQGKTAYVNGQKVAGEISTLVSAGTTPEFVNGDIRMPYGGNDRVLLKKDTFFYASADKFGDAAAENVLKGKTFTSAAGLSVTGTMETQGGGIDTSDATATANDIAQGKTAYVNGEKVNGTISTASNIVNADATVKQIRKTPVIGNSYYEIEMQATGTTAPGGSGKYIFDGESVEISLDVNSSRFGNAAAENVLKGKTFTSSAGLAVAGTHVCKQPKLQTKSVTPSAAAQNVTPDSGYDGLSSVAVAGDANLIPANIKKNTKIFGVTGEMETGIDTSDATATENDIVGGVFAYAKGKKIAGALSTIMSYPTTPSFVDEQIRFPYSDSRSIVDSGSFFYSTASKFGDATASDVAKGKTFTSAAGVSVVGTREAESGGIDTSDATATASDIAQGKTAYVNGEKVTGMISKTSNIANAEATVKQVQRTPVVGSSYYEIEMQATGTTAPGSGKHIFDGESVKLSLDVNSSKFGNAAAENVLKGKTFTSSAGLAVAGTHVCKQPKLQTKSVTPSAAAQNVTPDSGYDGLSSVAVAGDANLTAANIKKGVSVFGIAGTHECPAPKLHEKQITPSAAAETYYPDEGYDGIYKISVVGDPDLSPENVVYGKKIFDVVGSHKCPTFITQEKTVTPSANSQTVQPDSGYDGLSQVTVSGDTNLTPANIRKDISIFGVTGTMETPGGGTDTSDATATAEDIAKDKTAYVNGEKITGTAYDHLVTRDVSPTNLTVLGKKSIGLRATASGACHIASGTSVSLSMDADKWGTAAVTDVLKGKTFTSENGVKIAGTYEPPSTEPSLQAKSVTPSAAAQNVTPDSGYDGLSQVTVSGDTNLTAGNIKKGVSIFGVIGAYEEAASGGNGNNNCEAYLVDVTNPAVNFKTASGTIKAYGYAYATSSSGWGGSTTSVYAFNGTNYYKSVSYGSPQSTNITLGVSGGKLTGLPTLNGGTLLVVRGI